jgi:hypothetical protein
MSMPLETHEGIESSPLSSRGSFGKDERVVSHPPSFREPRSHLATFIQRLFKQLSGSMLLIKAVGWSAFFIVWFMRSHTEIFDLDKIVMIILVMVHFLEYFVT